MKTKLVAVAITATTMLTLSHAVVAADGQIDFTGSVTDTACIMDIGTDNKMTVALGNVDTASFSGVDSTSSATEFNIKLKSCPEATNASVKFDGTTVAGKNDVLALTSGTGVATGVGIQIKDKSSKVVNFYNATDSYPLTEGDNTLPFHASFIQTDTTVVAGTANATAQFTLNYN
jgi:major type 1 subunit fimbrin (pilin)